jgi:hypothetical protein
MKQRATRRNSLLGRLFGSKTTYRRTRTAGTSERPVSARSAAKQERVRESERLERKLTDAQLERKLKAHYAKGGSLHEFLAANPGIPGAAFKRCVAAVAEKGGAYDPRAVCASAGRKKYGAKKFQAMAKAGRKRAARGNPKGLSDLTRSEAVRLLVDRYGFGYDQARKALDARGVMRGYPAVYTAKSVAAIGNKARKNPAAAAAEVYEEFHGTPSTSVVEMTERVHFHEHLAELGRLELLVVNGIDGYEHRISGFKGAKLCSNESKDQLFIRGGDQEIDLADYKLKPPHEVETLGQVTEIQYFTTKKHLGSEGGTAIYFHKAGTTSSNGRHKKVGYGPDLIYRVRDKALEFSGGTYEIRAEGIDK